MRPPRTTPRITCNGCENNWTALNAAHCSACHQTFSGALLFDRHRSAQGERGRCLNPATITKVETKERVMYWRNGMWRGPEVETSTIKDSFTRAAAATPRTQGMAHRDRTRQAPTATAQLPLFEITR